MTEEWRPVVGYEGIYEVSDQGRVRSLDRVHSKGIRYRGQILSPRRNPYRGHLDVALYKDDIRTSRPIHQLVLEAFTGPRPEGMEACHWNDVSGDNRLLNLRWGTRSDNRKDCVRNGNDGNARKTHCRHGHAYTPENTYIYPSSGGRACRECRTSQRIARRSRVKEEAIMNEKAA